MTFSYSGNPKSSPKDEVRFLLGDTNKSRPMMSNHEINYLIDEEGSPLQAAISGSLQLAAKYSRMCDETVGKVKKDYSQRSKAFLKLADELRKKVVWSGGLMPYAGGISISGKSDNDSNPDRVKPIFTRETHNNDNSGDYNDNIKDC